MHACALANSGAHARRSRFTSRVPHRECSALTNLATPKVRNRREGACRWEEKRTAPRSHSATKEYAYRKEKLQKRYIEGMKIRQKRRKKGKGKVRHRGSGDALRIRSRAKGGPPSGEVGAISPTFFFFFFVVLCLSSSLLICGLAGPLRGPPRASVYVRKGAKKTSL